jgi:formate dehydrogenase subunit delta
LPVESLVKMANQIAANLRHRGHDVAVAAFASHVKDFWAPSMLADLSAHIAAGAGDVDPIAVEGMAALK